MTAAFENDAIGETVVLKLGGSVITDKTTRETIDEGALDDAAAAIGTSVEREGVSATSGTQVVLVHGAGSFGHYHASEHGVSTAQGTHDARAARAIHDAMRRLDDRVLDALGEHGVPALPVHPLSIAARNADGELTLSTDAISRMLGEGFVPVLFGDVVAHAGAGVTILSGDEIVVELAACLDADRVGLCSAVPGVLDSDGEVIEQIASFEAVRTYLDDGGVTDVTGGMAGKVSALLALDAPASVFALDRVDEFMAGGAPGTLVDSRDET